jgi:hypothetical protein
VYGIYPQLPSFSALIQKSTTVNFNLTVGPVKEKFIYGAGLSPILSAGHYGNDNGGKVRLPTNTGGQSFFITFSESF